MMETRNTQPQRCMFTHDGFIIEFNIQVLNKCLSSLHVSWLQLECNAAQVTNPSVTEIMTPQFAAHPTMKLGENFKADMEINFCAKILDWACVREELTGLKLPCILLQEVTSTEINKIYFIMIKDKELIPTGFVEVPSCILQVEPQLHIMDGPCLFIADKDNLYFTKKTSDKLALYFVKNVFYNKGETCPVIHSQFCLNGDIIIMGTVKISNAIIEERNEKMVAMETNEISVCGTAEINDDQILDLEQEDEEYCVQCFLLSVKNDNAILENTGMENVVPHHLTSPDTLFHFCIKQDNNCMYVGSDNKKNDANDISAVSTYHFELYCMDDTGTVYHINNGHVIKTTKITVSSAVKTVERFEGFGGDMYLCISTTDTVFLLRESDFQLTKQWVEAQAVVGDFLGYGSGQLLIAASKNIRDLFELTDFGAVHIDMNAEVESCTSLEESESLQSATRALETRLQDGMSLLLEMEQSCLLKQQVIEDSVKAVKCVSLDEDLQRLPKHPTLVNLVNSSEVASIPNHTTGSPSSITRRSLTVKDIWRKLYNNKWIIGADLVNETPCCVENVFLTIGQCNQNSFVLDSTSKSSHSSNLKPENPDFGDEHQAKRKKIELFLHQRLENKCQGPLLPNQKTTVTVSCPLPVFETKSFVKLSVHLHWSSAVDSIKTRKHCARNPLSFDYTLRCYVIMCGSLNLNIDDLTSGQINIAITDEEGQKLTAQEIERNLFSLNLAQKCIKLQVESVKVLPENADTSLSILHRILKKLGMRDDGVFQYFMVDQGFFKGMRLDLKRIRRTLYWMTVYYEDVQQITAFLHTLYNQLPQNVAIRHRKELKLLDCSITEMLTHELDYASHAFRNILQEDKKDSERDMGMIRERFGTKNKRNLQDSADLVTYSEVKRNLFALQEQTDMHLVHKIK